MRKFRSLALYVALIIAGVHLGNTAIVSMGAKAAASIVSGIVEGEQSAEERE